MKALLILAAAAEQMAASRLEGAAPKAKSRRVRE
jgi:hypothetical protein